MTAALVVTDAGLQGAANAAASGIKITLAEFKIGDAVNYTPVPSDTALHGNILYTGTITSFTNQPDGSLLVTCTIPAEAGPFDFGEIGLYTDAGVLFALTSLDVIQHKYTSLGSNIPSTFTFNLFLKVGQGTSIFNMDPTGPVQYPINFAHRWADVLPQNMGSPHPIYQTIVSQLDNKGDMSTLVAKADGKWSIQGNFYFVAEGKPITYLSPEVSFIIMSEADWQHMVPGDITTSMMEAAASTFVFETAGGLYRQASISQTASGIQIAFDVPFQGGQISVGQTYTLYVNNIDFGSSTSLTYSQVVTALGYIPASINSPEFIGAPTAPTPAVGDSTKKLATTEFVQQAILNNPSAAGVTTFNGRAGAVTLSLGDSVTSLTSGNPALEYTATAPSTVPNEANFTIRRKANYSGGGQDPYGNRLVQHALGVNTTTNATASNCEWTFAASMVSNANISPGALPTGQAWPQNLAIFGGSFQQGTAPIWGANIVAYNSTGNAQVAGVGAVVGMEINVGINGTDNVAGGSSVGIDAVPMRSGGTTAFPYVAFRASGDGINTGWQYGFYASTGTIASFMSSSTSQFGVRLSGNYVVGVDTTEANISGGTALRMKAGQAIGFESTDQVKMRFNASNGYLEFYNGTTRHGYIDAYSGADVNFNAGGGGAGAGVSSFNTRTGAVTLTGSDVNSAFAAAVTNTSGTFVLDNNTPRLSIYQDATVFTGGWNAAAGEVEVTMDVITNGYFTNNPDGHCAIILRHDSALFATAVRGQGMILGNVNGNTTGGATHYPTTQIETWFNGLAASDNYLPPASDGYNNKPLQDGVQYRVVISSKVLADSTSYIRYRLYRYSTSYGVPSWQLERDTGDVLDPTSYIDRTKSGLGVGHVSANGGAPAWTITFENVKTVWRPLVTSTIVELPSWVGGSVAGSGVTSFNTRTGAVVLNSTDVSNAVRVPTAFIQSTPSTSDTGFIQIQRVASYSGSSTFTTGALTASNTMGANVGGQENGIFAQAVNNSSVSSYGIGVYGRGDRTTSAASGTGVAAEAADMTNAASVTNGGATVPLMASLLCNGADNGGSRVGIIVSIANAQKIRNNVNGIGTGVGTHGIRVSSYNDDANSGYFLNGVTVSSGTQSSFFSNASGTTGVKLTGSYAAGVDVSGATISGSAVRIKSGDAVAFDGSDTVKVKYNPGTGFLEFYNGTTRRGYVNVTSGADVSFNAGGTGGVTSFNTRTGTVTLTTADVTGVVTAPTTFNQTSPAAADVAFVKVTRSATYSGGASINYTAGFASVSSVGASVTGYESAIVGKVTNSSGGSGAGIGVFGISERSTATANAAGMAVEAVELTNAATTSGQGTTVGQQITILANGADNGVARQGIVVAAGNAQKNRNGVNGIGAGAVSYGVRITSQNSDPSLGYFYNGIYVESASSASFWSSANGTRGLFLSGTYDSGIDLSLATTSSSAIRLKANNAITFEATDAIKMKYNSGTGFLEFYNGTTRRGYVNVSSGADVSFNAGGSITSDSMTFGNYTLPGTGPTNVVLAYFQAPRDGYISIAGTFTAAPYGGSTNGSVLVGGIYANILIGGYKGSPGWSTSIGTGEVAASATCNLYSPNSGVWFTAAINIVQPRVYVTAGQWITLTAAVAIDGGSTVSWITQVGGNLSAANNTFGYHYL